MGKEDNHALVAHQCFRRGVIAVKAWRIRWRRHRFASRDDALLGSTDFKLAGPRIQTPCNDGRSGCQRNLPGAIATRLGRDRGPNPKDGADAYEHAYGKRLRIKRAHPSPLTSRLQQCSRLKYRKSPGDHSSPCRELARRVRPAPRPKRVRRPSAGTRPGTIRPPVLPGEPTVGTAEDDPDPVRCPPGAGCFGRMRLVGVPGWLLLGGVSMGEAVRWPVPSVRHGRITGGSGCGGLACRGAGRDGQSAESRSRAG